MIQIDNLNFEHKETGIIIQFTKISENQYSFSVKGDLVLTKKLLGSVKHKQVQEKYIPICAKALFRIIDRGIFKKLVTDDEFDLLCERFHDLFDKMPMFEIQTIREGIEPLFSAVLLNVPIPKVGTGRTKQEAKAIALHHLFV